MVAVAQKKKLTGDVMANCLGCAQGDNEPRAQPRISVRTAHSFQYLVPNGVKFLSIEHGSHMQISSVLL